jgi:hypothetical protein
VKKAHVPAELDLSVTRNTKRVWRDNMGATEVMQRVASKEHSTSREVMQIPEEVFQKNFNKSPFVFEHNLSDRPAFSMERLEKLLELTIPHPDLLYWDAGEKRIDQRWNEKPGRDFSAQEAFRRIRESGAWIILFGASRDPEIAELLDASMEQVRDLSGYDLFKDTKTRDAYIFITAPHRVTTYHMDFQCGFLLQLRGSKELHVFDQTDRENVPEVELEKFWTKDTNAAVYKPEFENRAKVVQLVPGIGAHLPVNAPHWLKNGDDISVSLSLNFQFKNSVLANIYRTNYYLRRFGFQPTPPGVSAFKDRLKGNGMNIPVEAAKLLKKLKGKKAASRI